MGRRFYGRLILMGVLLVLMLGAAALDATGIFGDLLNNNIDWPQDAASEAVAAPGYKVVVLYDPPCQTCAQNDRDLLDLETEYDGRIPFFFLDVGDDDTAAAVEGLYNDHDGMPAMYFITPTGYYEYWWGTSVNADSLRQAIATNYPQ